MEKSRWKISSSSAYCTSIFKKLTWTCFARRRLVTCRNTVVLPQVGGPAQITSFIISSSQISQIAKLSMELLKTQFLAEANSLAQPEHQVVDLADFVGHSLFL